MEVTHRSRSAKSKRSHRYWPSTRIELTAVLVHARDAGISPMRGILDADLCRSAIQRLTLDQPFARCVSQIVSLQG